MDKTTILDRFKELGIEEDEVRRREILATLTDDISTLYDEFNSKETTIHELNQTIDQNKEDMEKLRAANMSLFLRVGANKEQNEIKENSTGIKPDEDKKLKFEDLFDEKGGLK